MFNNIIYFIVVLFIYNISYIEGGRLSLSAYDLLIMSNLYIAFLLFTRIIFQGIVHNIHRYEHFVSLRKYHRAVFITSLGAILIFAVDVFFFRLKYWINLIPGAGTYSTVGGVIAICVFLFYLCTIWYFSYPAYSVLFDTRISLESFIKGNISFNLPILFPWVFLSLMYDLISVIRIPQVHRIISGLLGQSIFFGFFLLILMIFMPVMIRIFWRCQPFYDSEKVEALKSFLKKHGFKYRNILRWPLFEGRIMTAGIMGIIPRYRFILITDSLMSQLSTDELKAVLAHEMGHARYGHLVFYFVFFMGYVILSAGLFDIFFYYILSRPEFFNIAEYGRGVEKELLYIWISIPLIISMILYFRYVMGFFMRNFERQADLYSVKIMGTPLYTINSLEKIAFMSGKIRDMPSWHHYSIRERVECLLNTIKDASIIKRHNRFVALSFIIYLSTICSLGYTLYLTPFKERVIYGFIADSIEERITKGTGDVSLYMNLAMIYHQLGKEEDSIKVYEKILKLDPGNHVALNNLAWLLATTRNLGLKNPKRALELARKAVSLERSPAYLDTLAEAYFVCGKRDMAIKTIKKAISIAKENRSYYKAQLKRFSGH
jgi:Zn-dependent protease with chaperone function